MTNKISNVISAVFVICLFASTSFASQTGTLKIIVDKVNTKVFVDGNFEGRGLASKDNIIVGSHLVQVKDDAQKILFEEMVIVKEGEQATVYAKTDLVINPATVSSSVVSSSFESVQAPKPSSRHVFGIEGSYGVWTMNSTANPTSIDTPNPMKEVGLFFKNVSQNNTYVKGSFHYIFPLESVSGNSNVGTFAGLDIGGETGLLNYSLGVNYLLSSMSGITGNAGGQAFVGLNLGGVTVGAKYLLLTGNANVPSATISFYHLLLGVSFDFVN